MIRSLQLEASIFFEDKLPMSEKCRKISKKESNKFYLLMIVQHFANPELIVTYMVELFEAKLADPVSILGAIYSLSLPLKDKGEDMKKLASIISLINAKCLIDQSLMISHLPESLINLTGLMESAKL